MKTRIFKLLLITGGSLLALAGLEAGTRVAAWRENQTRLERALTNPWQLPRDRRAELRHLIRRSENPRIVYTLKPNLSAIFRGQELTTNELGFRGRSYPRAKPPGTRRIVGIGDSVMFGWGLADGEDYLSRLEAELERTAGAGRWEVINTAVPGFNTVMEVETLRQEGLAFHPDLVILGLVSNDWDLPNFLLKKENPFDPTKSFFLEFLRRRMRGGPSFQRALLQVPKPENRDPWLDERFAGEAAAAYRHLVGKEPFAQALEELSELSRQAGFRVAVVRLSPKHQASVTWALKQCRGLGFDIVDVGAVVRRFIEEQGLESPEDPQLILGSGDPHPTARVHQMAAEELAKYVRERWGSTEGDETSQARLR